MEPLHPPSTLEQMTKYLSVSKALPGPIMLSHQPGLLSPSCHPAAWASPVRAWSTRIAFDFSGVQAAVRLVGQGDGRERTSRLRSRRAGSRANV